jgi:hypothetical protein
MRKNTGGLLATVVLVTWGNAFTGMNFRNHVRKPLFMLIENCGISILQKPKMEKFSYRDSGQFDANAPLKIDQVEVLWVEDDSQPDFLGTYSNEPEEGAIDREALGERRAHEFRYFNPANYDPNHPEYALADYRRYQSFCDGEWTLQGCVARAVVSYPIGGGVRRMEVFSSGGLYGIESDSSVLYTLEVSIEQLEDLKRHVQIFGIPWSNDAETLLGETRFRLAAEQTHEETKRQISQQPQQT